MIYTFHWNYYLSKVSASKNIWKNRRIWQTSSYFWSKSNETLLVSGDETYINLTYGVSNFVFGHVMQKNWRIVFSECEECLFCILCTFIQCCSMKNLFKEMCPLTMNFHLSTRRGVDLWTPISRWDPQPAQVQPPRPRRDGQRWQGWQRIPGRTRLRLSSTWSSCPTARNNGEVQIWSSRDILAVVIVT